jgi:hypothetical protein
VEWVDYKDYFGPNRRRGRNKRLLDRRKDDVVGNPPSLRTALRQLRLRVMDTQKRAGADAFLMRVQATASLAAAHGEDKVARMLMQLAKHLARANGADVRQQIYDALDTVTAAVQQGER